MRCPDFISSESDLKHLGQSSPWLRFGWPSLVGCFQCGFNAFELNFTACPHFCSYGGRPLRCPSQTQATRLANRIYCGCLGKREPIVWDHGGCRVRLHGFDGRSMSIGSLIRHAAEWGGAAALGLLPFLYCFVVAGSDDRSFGVSGRH